MRQCFCKSLQKRNSENCDNRVFIKSIIIVRYSDTGNFSTLFLLGHYFLPKHSQDYYTFCPAICPVGGLGGVKVYMGFFSIV